MVDCPLVDSEQVSPYALYCWTQGSDEIEVAIPIPKDAGKRQIDVVCTKTAIKCGLKGETPKVHGLLFAPSAFSTWSLEKGMLRIHIEKKEKAQLWPALVKSADKDKLDPQSAFNIASAHEAGQGLFQAQDLEKALEFYKISAEAKFYPALIRLAFIYSPEHKPPFPVEHNEELSQKYQKLASEVAAQMAPPPPAPTPAKNQTQIVDLSSGTGPRCTVAQGGLPVPLARAAETDSIWYGLASVAVIVSVGVGVYLWQKRREA